MSNINSEGLIEEFCGELGIDVPPFFNDYTIIDPGAKTKYSIFTNVYRKANDGDIHFSLRSITDLTRNAVLLEDYSEMPKFISKLKKIDPALSGCIKYGKNSGYIGVHLQTQIDDIPGEIQLSKTYKFKLKKIADANYLQTRVMSSLVEKYKRNELTKDEIDGLGNLQKDYARRCAMEKKLFDLIRQNTNLDYHIERIEELLKCFGDYDEPTADIYPYSYALGFHLDNGKGKIYRNVLKSVVETVHPYLEPVQKKLCYEASEPLQSVEIIRTNRN